MIEIYRLESEGYMLIATIDESDASVSGASLFANFLRDGFAEMKEEHGFDPMNHMDKIRDRLEWNYNDGYYLIV